ncbi:hypothetical protein O0544_00105 [Edwardsiella anguillarum]|nr:hypothetical protein [Edwardsiella anguillarum]
MLRSPYPLTLSAGSPPEAPCTIAPLCYAAAFCCFPRTSWPRRQTRAQARVRSHNIIPLEGDLLGAVRNVRRVVQPTEG